MGLVHHPNVVTDGLVYCLDAANRRCYSGTGTTGVDLVKGGTATLENQVTFGSNNMGVFAFDGTDDYIEQDWSFTLGTGDLTMEFWVKMEGWIIHSQGANVFLSVIDPDVHEELQFGIEGNPAQRLAVYLHGGSNGTKTGDEVYSWNLNQWYHLVATRISSTVALYRDGVSLTVATGATNTGDVAAISTFLLGNQYKSTQYKHDFQGDMGPIRIYNKGLTADEVKQNYEALKPRFAPRITKSGLVASWDAGDPNSYNGGTTLKDTANNYDGTFVNNGSGADISFDSANGGSLVFDGSDDYVNITTLPNCSSLARSVIIWLSVDDWPTSGSPVYAPFQSATDQFNIGFGITDGKIYFNGGGGTASTAQIDVALSPVPADGEWICWAMTIDSSGNIVAMYRNAVALSETANSSGPTIRTGTTIGCRLNSSTVENPLDGKIGSVRLYTKTLSAAEILDNYNATKGRFT